MANQTDKTKFKRLSPSQRIHVRRLKQAARNELTMYRAPMLHQVPAAAAVEAVKAPAVVK